MNLKMKPDEQVPAAEYSTVDFTQKGRQYGGLLDTLFTMDTTMYIRMNISLRAKAKAIANAKREGVPPAEPPPAA